MEEGFPLAAFERMSDFSPPVAVGEPFTVFRIGEVAPGVLIDLFEPVGKFSFSGGTEIHVGDNGINRILHQSLAFGPMITIEDIKI